MSQFEAVLFDAGDTLIRLSGSGEKLLHRAAATLGVDRLDPEKVAHDVRQGYVSAAVARQIYRVALDGEGRVDMAATRQLRRGASSG